MLLALAVFPLHGSSEEPYPSRALVKEALASFENKDFDASLAKLQEAEKLQPMTVHLAEDESADGPYHIDVGVARTWVDLANALCTVFKMPPQDRVHRNAGKRSKPIPILHARRHLQGARDRLPLGRCGS